MNVLKDISTIRKVRGDRVLGYDEVQDIYVVMMWDNAWLAIPGLFKFKPTHWAPLPPTRARPGPRNQ